MTNWIITGVLVAILLGSAWRGYRLGLGITLVNFGGFLLATGVASAFYLGLSSLLYRFIGTPHGLINLAAFVFLWLAVELLYRLGLSFIRLKKLYMPESAASLPSRIGGAVIGLAQAFLITTLALITLLALPFPGGFRNQLAQAMVAKQLIAGGGRYQQQVNSLVSDLSETLNFLTVQPKSEESLKLGFKTTNVRVDSQNEHAMLGLINHERISRGLQPLVLDTQISDVARAHSRDMFARGYFSHVTPERVDPFERMRAGGVKYVVAGENLALAPTLELAHNGLMNSPGHKANILEPSFRRVGIGVIDGGIYGEMFTQDFAD